MIDTAEIKEACYFEDLDELTAKPKVSVWNSRYNKISERCGTAKSRAKQIIAEREALAERMSEIEDRHKAERGGDPGHSQIGDGPLRWKAQNRGSVAVGVGEGMNAALAKLEAAVAEIEANCESPDRTSPSVQLKISSWDPRRDRMGNPCTVAKLRVGQILAEIEVENTLEPMIESRDDPGPVRVVDGPIKFWGQSRSKKPLLH